MESTGSFTSTAATRYFRKDNAFLSMSKIVLSILAKITARFVVYRDQRGQEAKWPIIDIPNNSYRWK